MVMKYYPIIEDSQVKDMHSEIKQVLTMFEASNVMHMTRQYTEQEVRDWILANTGDPALVDLFKTDYLIPSVP